MAKTGQPGGRQSLETKRVHGPIHAAPPSVESAPQSDLKRNASVRKGSPNTNRSSTPASVPSADKFVPTSGKVSYPSGRPNTNRSK